MAKPNRAKTDQPAHPNSRERIASSDERARAKALAEAASRISPFTAAWHKLLPSDLLVAGERYRSWQERSSISTVRMDDAPAGEYNLDAAIAESELMLRCEGLVTAECKKTGLALLNGAIRQGMSPTNLAAAGFVMGNRAELQQIVHGRGKRLRDVRIAYAQGMVERMLQIIQDEIQGTR